MPAFTDEGVGAVDDPVPPIATVPYHVNVWPAVAEAVNIFVGAFSQ